MHRDFTCTLEFILFGTFGPLVSSRISFPQRFGLLQLTTPLSCILSNSGSPLPNSGICTEFRTEHPIYILGVAWPVAQGKKYLLFYN